MVVTGLPPTGSWQDLKDHFREAGDVIYTDVFNDGTGVVEFSRRDGMRTAMKHLDDTKFRSHEVCMPCNNVILNVLKSTFTGRDFLHSCEGGC